VREVAPGSRKVCVDASKASGGTSTTGYQSKCYATAATVAAAVTTSAGTLALAAK
jgi:hypothetical protein